MVDLSPLSPTTPMTSAPYSIPPLPVPRSCKYCAASPEFEIAPTPENAPRPASIMLLCPRCGGCVCCSARVDIAPDETLPDALLRCADLWARLQARRCSNRQATLDSLDRSIARRKKPRSETPE